MSVLPSLATPEYELILPSNGKTIKYRPFLVREEKILLMALESDDEHELVGAVKQIVRNCVLSDVNVDTLPMFDLEYLFLKLRSRSIGDVIKLTIKPREDAPEDCVCSRPREISINLEEVEVVKNPKHSSKIKLTKDVGVIMKYPDFKMLEEIQKLNDSRETDRLFKIILRCIKSVYEKDQVTDMMDIDPDDAIKWLESLTQKQFEKLQEFFETIQEFSIL